MKLTPVGHQRRGTAAATAVLRSAVSSTMRTYSSWCAPGVSVAVPAALDVALPVRTRKPGHDIAFAVDPPSA